MDADEDTDEDNRGVGTSPPGAPQIALTQRSTNGENPFQGSRQGEADTKFQTCAPGHPVSTESGTHVERGRAILGQPAGCPAI